MNTPVLFLTYNRPELTKRLMESLRRAKPSRLFVASDGPAPTKPHDEEKCREVRRLVREGIDWDCKVQRLEREKNLGCKRAVSTAIDWFFEQVEEGIILEDDTLPAPDFFPFCEALLATYRAQPAVWHISGDNFQCGRNRGEGSYYFSIYSHVWGWATWRRAWRHYDADMKAYPAHRKDDQWLGNLSGRDERRYWLGIFDEVHQGKIDTWDYQWTFTVFLNNGLCIMPNVNLVSNIGHGAGATHTDGASPVAGLATGRMNTLIHPARLAADREADRFSFEQVIAPQHVSLSAKLRFRCERMWRRWSGKAA